MDMIAFIAESKMKKMHLKLLALQSVSILQLFDYLIRHEYNDENDMLKSKALIYFEERLEFEIESFVNRTGEPCFFVCDIVKEEDI